MLLASQVILIRILAVVYLCASGADFLERGARCGSGGGGFIGEDLFSKDLGCERWQGSYSSFQIVATVQSAPAVGHETTRRESLTASRFAYEFAGDRLIERQLDKCCK